MFENLNLQVRYIQHQSSECLIYTFFLKVFTVIMVIRQYDVGRDGETRSGSNVSFGCHSPGVIDVEYRLSI